MESLDISDTSLERFPYLGRTQLKKVCAKGNRICNLWEEDMPATIEELDLECNSIGDDGLLVEWPHTLKRLILKDNPIYSLDTVDMWPRALKHLDLSYTCLRDVLPILPDSIEFLNVSHTDLSNVFRLPANCREFKADFTRIHRLPIAIPDDLKILSVTNSNLKGGGIPRSWGAALEELNFHGNFLRQFPKRLPANLRSLNLSYNLLDAIGPVPEGLQILHLGRNRIRQIPAWLLNRRSTLYTVQDNCLLEYPADPNCLSSESQWVGDLYHEAARRIQRRWIRLRIRPGLRAWRRQRIISEELVAVAMSPERVGLFAEVDAAWGLDRRLI